jgi:predicted enzyme related to lactoylglutathione lyase
MLLGLRTVGYHVDDLAAAKDWYMKLLGFPPYFDQPFYVGFNVGGYELGLNPDLSKVSPGGKTIVYWGVKNAATALTRLLELGAKAHSDIEDVGEGIRVASVLDPWGNIFGVIENPHFKPEAAQPGAVQ